MSISKIKSARSKSLRSKESLKSRDYSNVEPGYVSWVKNVIAPALVEMYLRQKPLAGGSRA